MSSTDETVEVGEITIQYTAHGEAAAEEMAAFRKQLRESVSGLDAANAVVEMHSLPEFDARLSWGNSEPASQDGGREGVPRGLTAVNTPYRPGRSEESND